MVTVINDQNPSPRTVMIEHNDESSVLGWAVAVIVLLIVIVGGAYLWFHYHAAAPAQTGGTNVNVTLPGGTSNTGTPPASTSY